MCNPFADYDYHDFSDRNGSDGDRRGEWSGISLQDDGYGESNGGSPQAPIAKDPPVQPVPARGLVGRRLLLAPLGSSTLERRGYLLQVQSARSRVVLARAHQQLRSGTVVSLRSPHELVELAPGRKFRHRQHTRE